MTSLNRVLQVISFRYVISTPRFPGVVSIMDEVDFERVQVYQLTIQAMDGGKPPLSNQATVNVTITDINDNPPIFIQNSYSALVNEAAEKNERLVQVY